MSEMIHDVPLSDIWCDDEWNVRGYISPASTASLADDIAVRGQMQPIVIQPCINEELGTKFKTIMGHRRYEAIKLLSRNDKAKWGTIKARIVENTVSDADALLMNLKENLERVDLNMRQEANGIIRFKKAWNWDAARIARELGKPKRWVEVRFGLLRLPEEIQERAAAGYLTQYEVEKCIDFDKVEQQLEYVRNIVDHKLRGKKVTVKKKSDEEKRRKTLVTVMAKGEPRTIAEMALVQESIQDSFKDVRHPAAMVLAWAMGAISYEELIEQHVVKWADEAGVEFHHHPQIEEKLDAA